MKLVAEFRGPGVHHNFEDSDSGYEMDPENKGRSFGVGGYRGRIIFLGDGTEVLTDSDDTEMFDNADEAMASNERAADWARHNVLELARGMPEVMVGDVLVTEVK